MGWLGSWLTELIPREVDVRAFWKVGYGYGNAFLSMHLDTFVIRCMMVVES
jgi:hypothetical protein